MMTSSRFAAAFALSAALSAGACAQALAQDCAPRAGAAVPGTLVAPQAPCPPSVRRQTSEPLRERKEPGTFRRGSTTIHVGGSIVVDTPIRGR
ncbi:MAG TPA: hypothetical protein VHG27_00545 [Xanthobacteraceae bacterium]|nr:hypothetical protein [Xanthobacteraceae bacterium]